MYKVQVQTKKSYQLKINDLDLGLFHEKDNWNGFLKLVNHSGQMIILSDDSSGLDLAELFGINEDKEMYIVKASSEIIKKIKEYLSPSEKA